VLIPSSTADATGRAFAQPKSPYPKFNRSLREGKFHILPVNTEFYLLADN
jgi:hypothetical protein